MLSSGESFFIPQFGLITKAVMHSPSQVQNQHQKQRQQANVKNSKKNGKNHQQANVETHSKDSGDITEQLAIEA